MIPYMTPKNIIPGTFARASVANLPNGTQVGVDVARYDTARIVRGIIIEGADGAREAETLTIPTTGVFQKGNWDGGYNLYT